MLDRPTAVFRVCSPMLHPVAASAGDLLVFWPGHPSATLTVRAPGRGPKRIRRKAFVPDGVIYGALLCLLEDDVIVPLTLQDALLLPVVAASTAGG